jgi:methylenetetrahydrofolate dehydrogenase (NADP+)/methenyltetrahydrofolate cyclohydrolase
MPAELIDGVRIAREIRGELTQEVAELRSRGVTPGLSVVLVGDDAASDVYVRSKEKASVEAGMRGETIRLPASTGEGELLQVIDGLNSSNAVHGILVQMPLPRQINAENVVRRIRPEKDVDGFHPVNVGKLWMGDADGYAPCTPAGVRELLVRSGVETRGAHCVIVGRSNIVGKPMAALMLQQRTGGNSTVTVCHGATADLKLHTRSADILIVAIGKPGLLRGDMVRSGATVIDVGINRIPDTASPRGYRIVGDVAFSEVREVASRITPVPGGVGPMTIAMLLSNTVRAARRSMAS